MNALVMDEVKKLALIQHIPGGIVLVQEVLGAVLRVGFKGADFEVHLPRAVNEGGIFVMPSLVGPVEMDESIAESQRTLMEAERYWGTHSRSSIDDSGVATNEWQVSHLLIYFEGGRSSSSFGFVATSVECAS